MAKFLRLVVVLLLALSAAAAWMEYTLYQQREGLKERTQKLERTAHNLTAAITAAKAPHVEAIDKGIDAPALMAPDRMDAQLRVLDVLIDNRIDELVVSNEELASVTRERDTTKEDLAKIAKDVEVAQVELAPLAEQVKAKEAELAAVEAKIVDLEGRIDSVNQALEEQRAVVARMETEKVDMRDEIRRLEIELARYREERKEEGVMMTEGLTGSIVAVNSEWDFVVLDLGSKEGLVADAHMLVHRDDQLVGRIRITDVRPHMAIAEIQRDWATEPLQEGDHVLY